MSQWIRNYDPSEIDGDEWGHILVMSDNGIKTVYHWEDFVDDDATAEGYAWMRLPKSDVPQSISITIERGDRSWRIENRGFSIEIHDSRDPMGQPTVHEVTVETGANMNAMFAEAVLSVLESEDEDWCECECEGEGVAVNDTVLQGFLDAIRGKETASVPASKQKPWQKKRGK